MKDNNLNLFNENKYGEKFHEHLLDQYKIYIQMVDNISERRDKANNFFIGINSILIAGIGFLKDAFESYFIVLLLSLMILINIIWCLIISSYRRLNSGKFKIIHELEKKLPARLYECEWTILGQGKEFKYIPLSKLEKYIPICFIVFTISFSIFYILKYCT